MPHSCPQQLVFNLIALSRWDVAVYLEKVLVNCAHCCHYDDPCLGHRNGVTVLLSKCDCNYLPSPLTPLDPLPSGFFCRCPKAKGWNGYVFFVPELWESLSRGRARSQVIYIQ